MKSKEDRFFYSFWVKESALSSMLFLLFVMHFLAIPLLGNRSYFMLVVNIFWILLIISGIFALAKNKKQAVRMSFIPMLFVVSNGISFFTTIFFIEFIDLSLTIVTALLLIILVLIKVFEPGPVDKYRVIGSVVVYMLLANLWQIVYLFLYYEIDGSFQLTLSQFDINSDRASFMYFSYITLTSTGFGEIVPLHPIARAVVQMEALVGILYPVILIGRLVSDANFYQTKKS